MYLCWGRRHQFVALLVALLLTSASNAEAQAPVDLTHSKDKVHVALGPVVAARTLETGWDSQVGAEFHVVHVRVDQVLAIYGSGLGISTFGKREVFELHLELYAGTRKFSEQPVGISIGPVLEVSPHGDSTLGMRSTLWAYYGVMPYVSLVWVEDANRNQPVVELGVKLPFSILDW